MGTLTVPPDMAKVLAAELITWGMGERRSRKNDKFLDYSRNYDKNKKKHSLCMFF